MTLVTRNSLLDFDHFLDPVWPLSHTEGNGAGTFSPRVDVMEKGDHFEITAELPGVNKEDLHLNLEDGMLSIEAETKSESKEEKNGKIIRQERRYGRFVRRFNLDSNMQESDITAHFKNGVLHVNIPKRNEEPSNKHSIPIQQ